MEVLSGLTKGKFNGDSVAATAKRLKYLEGIKLTLERQIRDPDEAFETFLIKSVYSGPLTDAARKRMRPLIPVALREFLDEYARESLEEALASRGVNLPSGDGGERGGAQGSEERGSPEPTDRKSGRKGGGSSRPTGRRGGRKKREAPSLIDEASGRPSTGATSSARVRRRGGQGLPDLQRPPLL